LLPEKGHFWKLGVLCPCSCFVWCTTVIKWCIYPELPLHRSMLGWYI
jgi:hypothetical protein